VQSLLSDIARYVVALGRWLGSFHRIWLALAVPCGALALSALIPAKPDDQLRYCGLALQLLGVGTVIALLRDKSATFGRLGFLAYFRERFAARPRFRPPTTTISVSGVSSSSAVGNAHGFAWHGPAPAASPDERITMLEHNVETLRKNLDWHSQQYRQADAQLQTELSAERQSRQASVAAVEQRLERFGASGLHIEAAGLFWLVLGIILATIPSEIAKLLGLQ
jgi:uncharacterized protein YjeT (DUF2065 family)